MRPVVLGSLCTLYAQGDWQVAAKPGTPESKAKCGEDDSERVYRISQAPLACYVSWTNI